MRTGEIYPIIITKYSLTVPLKNLDDNVIFAPKYILWIYIGIALPGHFQGEPKRVCMMQNYEKNILNYDLICNLIWTSDFKIHSQALICKTDMGFATASKAPDKRCIQINYFLIYS